MRCVNSLPEFVIPAHQRHLKPGITSALDFMWRWSCLITWFIYFDNLIFVSSGSRTIRLHLAHCAVRSSITGGRNGLRRLALMPKGLAAEGFGGGHVAPPLHEVHRLDDSIPRTVGVYAPAAHLYMGLVDTPGATRTRSTTVTAFDQLGRIAPQPAGPS